MTDIADTNDRIAELLLAQTYEERLEMEATFRDLAIDLWKNEIHAKLTAAIAKATTPDSSTIRG